MNHLLGCIVHSGVVIFLNYCSCSLILQKIKKIDLLLGGSFCLIATIGFTPSRIYF
jgi:hypothetical protein